MLHYLTIVTPKHCVVPEFVGQKSTLLLCASFTAGRLEPMRVTRAQVMANCKLGQSRRCLVCGVQPADTVRINAELVYLTILPRHKQPPVTVMGHRSFQFPETGNRIRYLDDSPRVYSLLLGHFYINS